MGIYFDWPHHYIFIDIHKRPRYVRNDRWISKPGPWYHAPIHRRGVAYRDKSTARKYGQYPYRSRDFRRDTRGFPELIDRDRDRDRRIDDRTRIGRDKGGNDRSRIDRDRQTQQRVDQQRQARQQVGGEQQQRRRDDNVFNRVEDGRMERQSSERGRASRQGWGDGSRGMGHSGGDARGPRGDRGRNRR
jgi:hypothetical protein